MKVWIARNNSNVAMPISVNTGTKPTLQGGYWQMTQTNDLTEMHTPGSFKERYGFTPRKGSCKQYKLNLTEIK
jgi:hypothetical protein